MLSHLGHSRMAPMAASERTTSRAWQVVQVMEKIAFSTVPPAAVVGGQMSAFRLQAIVRYWRADVTVAGLRRLATACPLDMA